MRSPSMNPIDHICRMIRKSFNRVCDSINHKHGPDDVYHSCVSERDTLVDKIRARFNRTDGVQVMIEILSEVYDIRFAQDWTFVRGVDGKVTIFCRDEFYAEIVEAAGEGLVDVQAIHRFSAPEQPGQTEQTGFIEPQVAVQPIGS